MGLLHRCWQRLRTRRQVILSLTILPLDRGSPALMGGALLLTLAGKGQFHSFSRRNHHRDQRRGPRQHRRSASLRTAPNLAFHVLWPRRWSRRSEEHTSELQSRSDLVCRLLLEK